MCAFFHFPALDGHDVVVWCAAECARLCHILHIRDMLGCKCANTSQVSDQDKNIDILSSSMGVLLNAISREEASALIHVL